MLLMHTLLIHTYSHITHACAWVALGLGCPDTHTGFARLWTLNILLLLIIIYYYYYYYYYYHHYVVVGVVVVVLVSGK